MRVPDRRRRRLEQPHPRRAQVLVQLDDTRRRGLTKEGCGLLPEDLRRERHVVDGTGRLGLDACCRHLERGANRGKVVLTIG